MRFSGVNIFFCFIFCLSFLVASELPVELLAENQPLYRELYRIRIANQKEGLVEISSAAVEDWQEVGRVLVPALKVSREGFTASKWGKSGTVVASAVNALHLKTAHNREKDKGVLFSILPSNALDKNSSNYNSYLNKSSSIYTNIRGGTSIFGGEYSIFVGNLVYLETTVGLQQLPYDYVPQRKDKIVIIVRRPDPYPLEMIFENKAGGLIYLRYADGKKKAIAQVLKPVVGVGRFLGTKDSEAGRVRANHTGVIDISTSPLNKIGGFQIIPAEHSESPEMVGSKIKTQWMIVSALSALSGGTEGLSPLFSDYIIPRYSETAIYDNNWQNKVTERTLIFVKYRDRPGWQPMPVYALEPGADLPASFNTALKDVAEIRISFPLFKPTRS